MIFGFQLISLQIIEIFAQERLVSSGISGIKIFFPPIKLAILFIEVSFPEPKL